MGSVRAFQPRKIDPPYFVAFDGDELVEKIGEELPGEQCDNCGNSLYRIQARSRGFVAVCVTDQDRLAGSDAPEVEFTGCGTEWPIAIWDEEQVVF